MTLYFWPLLVPASALTVVSVFAGWTLATVLTGSVLLIWAGFVVHEAGHVVALRLLGSSERHLHSHLDAAGTVVPAAVVVDAHGARIHRPRLRERWREALVILAGPVFPVVVWAVAMAAIPDVPIAVVVWTGVVAWAHPVSLVVPAGDAGNLIRLWRVR